MYQVIKCVNETGLRVVATICDQGKPNEGAIRILNAETKLFYQRKCEEYRDQFYEVALDNGQQIRVVHLFDPPHLIKCLRNNLLTKDLIYEIDGVKRMAKWKHLEELYNADNCIPDSKMLPRLTDYHVIPDKIKKMKVRFATQVFSQRVASIMKFLAGNIKIESIFNYNVKNVYLIF